MSADLGAYIEHDAEFLQHTGWTTFVPLERVDSDSISLDNMHHPGKRSGWCKNGKAMMEQRRSTLTTSHNSIQDDRPLFVDHIDSKTK